MHAFAKKKGKLTEIKTMLIETGNQLLSHNSLRFVRYSGTYLKRIFSITDSFLRRTKMFVPDKFLRNPL